MVQQVFVSSVKGLSIISGIKYFRLENTKITYPHANISWKFFQNTFKRVTLRLFVLLSLWIKTAEFPFALRIRESYVRDFIRSNDATAKRTSLKKRNLRSFSLYRNYSYPLTLSNVSEPSWSWMPGTISKCRKGNKISSLLVYVLHKTRN